MDIAINSLEQGHLDVLKEIGNIGAGHAATALSEMLQTKVDMNVPRVSVVPFDKIAEYLGGGDGVVATIFLRVEGDAPGNMFLLLDLDSAKNLVAQLIGIESDQPDFTEIELSALQEIGNILAGSYLSSLADFTQLKLQPSVPAIAVDMALAILSYGLIELGRSGDYALVIDTNFVNGTENVTSHFFLIPDPTSFKRLFGSLGVPL